MSEKKTPSPEPPSVIDQAYEAYKSFRRSKPNHPWVLAAEGVAVAAVSIATAYFTQKAMAPPRRPTTTKIKVPPPPSPEDPPPVDEVAEGL